MNPTFLELIEIFKSISPHIPKDDKRIAYTDDQEVMHYVRCPEFSGESSELTSVSLHDFLKNPSEHLHEECYPLLLKEEWIDFANSEGQGERTFKEFLKEVQHFLAMPESITFKSVLAFEEKIATLRWLDDYLIGSLYLPFSMYEKLGAPSNEGVSGNIRQVIVFRLIRDHFEETRTYLENCASANENEIGLPGLITLAPDDAGDFDGVAGFIRYTNTELSYSLIMLCNAFMLELHGESKYWLFPAAMRPLWKATGLNNGEYLHIDTPEELTLDEMRTFEMLEPGLVDLKENFGYSSTKSMNSAYRAVLALR